MQNLNKKSRQLHKGALLNNIQKTIYIAKKKLLNYTFKIFVEKMKKNKHVGKRRKLENCKCKYVKRTLKRKVKIGTIKKNDVTVETLIGVGNMEIWTLIAKEHMLSVITRIEIGKMRFVGLSQQ